MAVFSLDGKFAIALGGAPSTHILKPGIATYPDIVSNEAACMQLGSATGFNVAEAEAHRVMEHEFFLVKHYDRVRIDEDSQELKF